MGCGSVHAQEIKVALIASRTGPYEAYAKQAEQGLSMGLAYATQNTMTVSGRKLTVLIKDDQFKPDRARALISEAFYDDKVDIAVGSTSSATTLAMMPVAQEAKKLLIVDIGAADQITGARFNRYVFRTGRSTAQEAIASAVGLAAKDTSIAVLAQDYAFGRDSVTAFKKAAESAGAKVVDEEFVPISATDFTAPVQRMFDALKDKPGRKVIWVTWVGSSPLQKINAMNPGRYGITLASPGTLLSTMGEYKNIPQLEGTMIYYYAFERNQANDWLINETKKRYQTVPDAGTALAFNAGIAIVKAIETAGGTDTEKLIKALEGMQFDSAKGPITIRAEDHQGLQEMYQVRFKTDQSVAWAVPELVRTLTPDMINLPVGVKHSN